MSEIQNLRNQVESLQAQLKNAEQLGYVNGRASVIQERMDVLTATARKNMIASEDVREAVRAQAWQAAGKEIKVIGDRFVDLPDGVPEGFDLDAEVETLADAQLAQLDQPTDLSPMDETVPPVVAAFRAGLGT